MIRQRNELPKNLQALANMNLQVINVGLAANCVGSLPSLLPDLLCYTRKAYWHRGAAFTGWVSFWLRNLCHLIWMNVQNEDLIYNQRKVIMKIFLIIISVILSGCVAYPYPAYPAGPDPYQAQALASEQCAKSGKVAVKIKPTNCNDTNCITAFECQ